jgi:DNA-directed RNA polymerase subunit RPC12/RpoP
MLCHKCGKEFDNPSFHAITEITSSPDSQLTPLCPHCYAILDMEKVSTKRRDSSKSSR